MEATMVRMCMYIWGLYADDVGFEDITPTTEGVCTGKGSGTGNGNTCSVWDATTAIRAVGSKREPARCVFTHFRYATPTGRRLPPLRRGPWDLEVRFRE